MIEEKKYLFLIINQGDNITYSLVELTISEIMKTYYILHNLNSCAFHGEPNISAYKISWADVERISEGDEKLNIPREEYGNHNIILWHDMNTCMDYAYSFDLPTDELFITPLDYISAENFLNPNRYPTLEEVAFDYRAGKWVD